jgi:rare lipoprotein A
MSNRPELRVSPRAWLALALLITLAACSSAPRREAPRPLPIPDVSAVPDAMPRSEPRSTHGNPPFYDVNGRRYQVLASAEGYRERGVASWYGPDFHGHNTSSGEPYDMYAMTAAHRTLPLPCYARITNLGNGRSVVVRINDRGPFVSNRIVDLSYTAAQRLDIVRTGTALVELQTVGPVTDGGAMASALPMPSPTPVPASTPANLPALYIQVGAYAEVGNAQRVVERLQAAGIDSSLSLASATGGRALRRVRVGPIASVEQFDSLAARLATLGYPDARLASD